MRGALVGGNHAEVAAARLSLELRPEVVLDDVGLVTRRIHVLGCGREDPVDGHRLEEAPVAIEVARGAGGPLRAMDAISRGRSASSNAGRRVSIS